MFIVVHQDIAVVYNTRGDYFVYFHPLTIVSNKFMRNGTYPLMFIGRVYITLQSK